MRTNSSTSPFGYDGPLVGTDVLMDKQPQIRLLKSRSQPRNKLGNRLPRNKIGRLDGTMAWINVCLGRSVAKDVGRRPPRKDARWM